MAMEPLRSARPSKILGNDQPRCNFTSSRPEHDYIAIHSTIELFILDKVGVDFGSVEGYFDGPINVPRERQETVRDPCNGSINNRP
jgi:hypothetical protein